MGQEMDCRLDYAGDTFKGKALLETAELIFRGAAGLRIAFKDMERVQVVGGTLHVWFPGGNAAFHLGAVASKWASKILNPPSRLDKLGVKTGTRVRWIGAPDLEFKKEAVAKGAIFVRVRADVTFLAASKASELGKIENTPLWIVYPKGLQTLKESDVRKAGLAAGLVDIKVASFSPTHTALKFVPRRSARRE